MKFAKPFLISITCLLAINCTIAQSISKLNWMVFPQQGVKQSALKISKPGFVAPNAINAVVPGTVFYSYVLAGKEKNPDYADNIYQVDKAKYNQPYWYRTEFTTSALSAGKRIWLNFNGVHKMADVYFNGKHLGTIKGIVERGRYDVTNLLNGNEPNAIAILVIPPNPAFGLANRQAPTYLSSGSWDWMPAVPGLNSGITDTVAVTATGPVAVQDPWVKTNLVSKKLAELNIAANLINTTNNNVTGNARVVIQPGNIVLTGPQISIAANSAKAINFAKENYKQLAINNPKLWWPNGYGEQNLYSCKVSFVSNKTTSDVAVRSFGIRKVTADTTALNGPMRLYINDVPVLVKGGNWGMSDYMLKVRGKDYEPRIRFHKEMNFNMIRNWTGEVTDEAFYQYCDKYGIMVWDDFWLNNFGPIDSLDNFRVNAIEKVKKFRHHPSVVIWCGANEGLPGGDTTGALSMAIKNAISENDGADKLYIPRSNAGPTNPNFSIYGGSRMLSGSGIWGNVDPKTYFTDPHNGYLFSQNSYGMRSELGTATFVNIESFKKFMPKAYWVAPTAKAVESKTNMWARHYFSTEGELGGGSQPAKYIEFINKSYGEATSLADFCKKAQMQNAETMKAMFEAWNDHMWKDASGMLIWMSQSAYPTMIWQTYDYYYDLTGAYFGAKSACEPVHIQWNAATNAVKIINNKTEQLNNLTATAEVYGTDGKLLKAYSKTVQLNADANAATQAFTAFAGTDTTALPAVYFLRLKLKDSKQSLLSENFYWLGKTYLDYKALNNMLKADITVSTPKINFAKNALNKLITYQVTNKSANTAAFGIRVQLLDNAGKQILPAILSDGYFSLMQGESKYITLEVDPILLKKGYKLEAKAYNN
ncbi:beta-mannosidase [Mucilaginibacter pallidiroseus]|uniref:Beta-mannosidase n=1 Tax=Mucilaginibacter pallidiroseus TaxID=2599295 RepID=A0A563TZV9_9SPHI|nr:sugar-binding domain-containing protein [Mucilaginibacter pallidiroseus]TWR24823.1 beta-mannosidase [Mucilaginibacter pallidiroseus]